jgi:hypothetical protein
MKEQRPDDLASAATTSGDASAAVPGKGTLVEQTYGAAPTRVASAPAHHHGHHARPHGATPEAQPAQPFNAIIKVVAYKGQKVLKTWGAKSHWEGPLPTTFTGTHGQKGWKWNDADAQAVRVNTNADGHGGVEVESWGRHLGADRIVVYAQDLNAVTVDDDAVADDKAPGHATDAKDAGDGSSADVAHGHGTEAGSGGGAPNGTGDHSTATSADGTGPEHRDGKQKGNDEGGGDDDGGDVDLDPNAPAEQFEQDLGAFSGKKKPSSGGGTGQDHPDGGHGTDKDGEKGGDPNSTGPGAKPNEGGVNSDSAEPDGKIAGDPEGQYDGDGRPGDRGVRGAVALFGGLVNVPKPLRGAVELGILINQGDVTGLGADAFKNGAKEFMSAAAARAALQREAKAVAKRETESALKTLAKDEAYQALSQAEKDKVKRIIEWQYQRDYFEGALQAARQQKEATNLIKRATKGEASRAELEKLATQLAKDDPETARLAAKVMKGDATAADIAQLEKRGARAAQIEEAAEVKPVAGNLPRNSEYAGKEFPRERLPEAYREKGLRFTKEGFPDFEPYAMELPSGGKTVQIELTNSYTKDFAAANRAAGLKRTPKGYIWHHVEDGRTMMLVPDKLHDAVRHTGGAAVYRGTHGELEYGR